MKKLTSTEEECNEVMDSWRSVLEADSESLFVETWSKFGEKSHQIIEATLKELGFHTRKNLLNFGPAK